MAFVSVTRLRLRSPLLLPAFFRLNNRIVKQLENAPGFRAGIAGAEWRLVFWTVSVWESEAAMKAFRGAQPHSEGFRALPEWCSEARTAHWSQQHDDLPAWEETWRRLVETGRPYGVKRPNRAHQTGVVTPARPVKFTLQALRPQPKPQL